MTTGGTIAIVGGGLALLYLMSKKTPVTNAGGITPAQQAAINAQAQAAALKAQNTGLSGILASIFGKGSAQSQTAPTGAKLPSASGQGGGSSGASAPASTALGHQASPCPITPTACANVAANAPPGAVAYDPSTGQYYDASGNALGTGTSLSSSGLTTCPLTGAPISGETASATTECPLTGSVINVDGGTTVPAGGVAPTPCTQPVCCFVGVLGC